MRSNILGATLGLAGCTCSTFQANAPEHDDLFGGAFGQGHDPCDERGAWIETRPGGGEPLVVFGAPYPALAFAWLTKGARRRSHIRGPRPRPPA